MLFPDKAEFLETILIPSIWHILIFSIASYISMNCYNQKYMNRLKRIDFRKRIELNKSGNSLIRVKRKSLIKIVNNRKLIDLSKWKDKNYLVVNRRYSGELSNKNIEKKKRIKSWHADSDFSSNNSRTIYKGNISNLVSSNSLSQDFDQTFDSAILTDFTNSICSSRSSIEILNENDENYHNKIDDDDSIIDMSYSIGLDSDKSNINIINENKVGFIKSFIYDILNKKYNKEQNLDNISSILYLKPFNLKKTSITEPNTP